MSRQACAALALAVLTAAGCANKEYVTAEIAAAEARVEQRLNQRVDEVESQVESGQARLAEQQGAIEAVSRTAREAMDRAIAAGRVAEGKFLFEQVLADDSLRFASGKAALGPEAEEALGRFAARLAAENANVFVEIQGHTDAQGGEAYNQRLGEERAQAVLRHLNQKHHVPLHRMSAMSYGESAPVGDNATAEGRAQNRRVLLVVLK